MRDIHGNNRVREGIRCINWMDSGTFELSSKLDDFLFRLQTKHCEMSQATVWLPESKDLMGEVASLHGGNNRQPAKTVCDICIIFFSSRLKKMALSALHSQHAHPDLPKACHSILHSPATSIKEKKNTLLLQVLSFPQNCLSFLYFLPPSHHQLISDMLSPLFSSSFIFFLRLVGCDSVHLIKMYIFKSFFKGKVFV